MMDNSLIAFLSICGVIAVGSMSPGPSFLLVAKTAMSESRRCGVFTALGMSTGCALFALAAIMGLQSILLTVPWLFWLLKIAGGVYLLYLAYQMISNARRPLKVEIGESNGYSALRGFNLGLLTQISNPQTALVFGSIFAAFLSHQYPVWINIALPIASFAIDFVWYLFVVMVLSATAPRSAYLRFKQRLDTLGGGLMALLGIKLIVSQSS
ncbi:LysE family translocator [Erwiniaceae bacterium BAC15a-03b]|uniref:LysE family translocator n=1 Tax=Winslowiella arboricola TaxID=2978220 RepID=A0A9J6PDZ0_9GAMM|nr:LysE family translocator [Winslowiella arboricola]MCU5771173.1 LysE family translocator [Winslowiella arboricola]MCU5776489.1 LysE family translocator [Winslowiella arboricola]